MAKLAPGPARSRRAAAASGRGGGASRSETTPSTCALKLSQWCEAGVEKITEDMESLEMHSAVRNVMRLFDRIKDFEKRVLAREQELERAPTSTRSSRRWRARADARPTGAAPRRGAVDRLRPTRSTAHRRRGQAYRCRCPHEHTDRPKPRRRGSGRVRARPHSPATAVTQLPARGRDLRLPRLRQGSRRGLRLRARRAATSREVPAPSARRTSGTSRSCCRSSTRRRRRAWEATPATRRLIRADRLGAELGLEQPVSEGRLQQPASLSYKDRVVSMSVARLLERGGTRDRVRVHRQRRHGGRLAGGQGGS